MLTVGSSAAISIVSSFSSCFSFDFARVAVLARRLVLGDELFEVPLLRQDARVDTFVLLAAFLLIFGIGINLPRIHRQLSARQVERVVARRPEKPAVM